MRGEIHVNIPKKKFLKCYWHLLKSAADVNFLWGGRDSGKSYFIACLLVMKCLSMKFFRCVLVRKTYASIEDSQYQLIKDVVTEWGLESLFRFYKSPLRIKCINGNSFIARGCDDPQNVKSITNPTHAWFEEGNQLEADDYSVVSTTLRSKKGRVQEWFSFNPECDGDFNDFWLFKDYFKDKPDLTFNDSKKMEIKVSGESKIVEISYTSTHVTYDMNPYCTDERRAKLELLQYTNPYYYLVYTAGLWGNKEVKDRFAFAFDREKHCAPVMRVHSLPIHLSFDFNKNPITCLVAQILPGHKVRCIEQIKLANSDIYALCEYINKHYPNALFKITGDATGQNTTAMVKDNLNFYRIIKQLLRVSSNQFKVPKVNPNLEDNQLLVNTVLALLDVQVDPVLCKQLVFDFENVAMRADGTIDKTNRTDPTKQADALDTFRYLLNAYIKEYMMKTGMLVITKKKNSEAKKAA